MKYLYNCTRLIFGPVLIALSCCKSKPAKEDDNSPAQANYYISPAGNDANNGSREHPWKSFASLKLVTLKAGDSVLLQGGQLHKGTLVINPHTAGTENKPVVISSYGNGNAVISSENEAGMIIDNSNFISIKNITLAGSGRKSGNTSNGINLAYCNNITIDNIDVSGYQKSGLLLQSCINALIENVFAHDNGFGGITVHGENYIKKDGRNIVIRYCRAENNPGDPTNKSNHSGNGIVVSQCVNTKISYCTATNNGWDMPRQGNGPVGIWAWDADSVVIEHCLSYRNKTSPGGEDGGGFDFDGGVTNSVIQYCLSYENAGSGVGLFEYNQAGPWFNNTIRYNISINDGNISSAKAGIYVWNASTTEPLKKCFIYNNTVYNSQNAAIRYARESVNEDFFFYNNILAGKNEIITGESKTAKYLGNTWWSAVNGFNVNGTKDFGKWRSDNGQEILNGSVVGINTNPGLVPVAGVLPTDARNISNFSDFKATTDQLINGGIDVSQLFGISKGDFDFNGNPSKPKGIGASY